jgi:hypothetical protein
LTFTATGPDVIALYRALRPLALSAQFLHSSMDSREIVGAL